MLQNFDKYDFVAGCDEAGRGPLAGPVFAAAVILPAGFKNDILDDSKKLSEKKRYLLQKIIIKEAIAWAVASVDNLEIDRINILNASIKAMHMALSQLTQQPSFILVDGNRFEPYKNIPHQTVVGGDGKFMSIAAASVLAKTFRDDYMKQIDKEFPVYNWKQNKGYPTRQHRQAILQFGLSKYHRRSFCNFYFQQKIDF